MTGAAAVGVVLLSVVCFYPALHNGFVFDDAQYIGLNARVRAGLTAAGARWAFTSFYAANWHPLTWLSHMADVSLFGLSPAGHHLTSVLVHALNAMLLFFVLQRSTGKTGRSLAVSALFAAHPLRVESVAWIAERKDVLSGFFFLATLAAYLRYLRRPGPARYLPVAALTAMSLMAKPMAVTLPFVLLLLDWWPLGRLGRPRGRGAPPAAWGPWLEKAPLLALAAASSVATLAAQSSIGAVQTLDNYAFSMRVGNALWSYAAYLASIVCPVRLAPLYPHLKESLAWWRPVAAAALLLALTAWALTRRRSPYLATGWLWYLGTLVPVVGLVQVGVQAMADRYTYLPAIGVTLALVWGAADIAAGRVRVAAQAATVLLLVIAAGAATRAYLGFWKDDFTLWQRALAVTRDNHIAEANFGAALARHGRLDAAIDHYRASLSIEPRNAEAWNNLGIAHSKSGRPAEAEAAFARSLSLSPGNADAWDNLGVVYGQQGRFREAATAHEKAIGLRPDFPGAHFNLGLAYLSLNDPAGARRVLDALRRLDPAWASKLAPFVPAAGR